MNKRNLLIAVVAVVVLAGAGTAGWMYYGKPKTAETPGTTGPAVTGDLMTPSPLGENELGNKDASITIIEYASTTCPHCAHFNETTFPELKKRYIDTGKARYIFREFPLNDLDFFAFMLTRCVAKDKFFDFLDVLFRKQDQWIVSPPASPLPQLLALAKQVGFTDESFEACRTNKSVYEAVSWSSEQGAKLKVNSTPTFFINGKKYSGALTIEQMEEILAPLAKN